MKFKKSRLRINAQALLWRILLSHKKYWICTILKIVLPTLLFGILVLITSYIPNLKGQAEEEIFQNDDLFDEIVKISNTTPIQPVVLFTPENNLTRDLTNRINSVINFLKGESNLGNSQLLFKNVLISTNISIPFWLSKSKKITKKLSVFSVGTIYVFVHVLKIGSKSRFKIIFETWLAFEILVLPKNELTTY